MLKSELGGMTRLRGEQGILDELAGHAASVLGGGKRKVTDILGLGSFKLGSSCGSCGSCGSEGESVV